MNIKKKNMKSELTKLFSRAAAMMLMMLLTTTTAWAELLGNIWRFH
jgi:hypothetical protein